MKSAWEEAPQFLLPCHLDHFFVLARSQVNLLMYLTRESYVPTSMLSTNKIDYATRRNIDVSEVPCSL